ncbi:MAG TPA: zinc ribbon domain-containing protein [Planctomycetota bacterium]|nr:zinc ribbon domain-containing protein [Planctomycetota bacterium]
MPIYVYQAKDIEKGCKKCQPSFEIMQRFQDNALTNCPDCNTPIHRVIQVAGISIGKKYMLSDDNLKKHGFSKLINEGDGKFRHI